MLFIVARWLIFLHVLAGFTFFMAHGTSAALAFRIRSERDFARLRAMLDLSGSTLMVMGIAFIVMGLSGLILPFLMKLWGMGYIWLSIVLLVVVVMYMTMVNQRRVNEVRRVLGMPYRLGNKEMAAEKPGSSEALAEAVKRINVAEIAFVGYGIPVIILWLMYFKPF